MGLLPTVAPGSVSADFPVVTANMERCQALRLPSGSSPGSGWLRTK